MNFIRLIGLTSLIGLIGPIGLAADATSTTFISRDGGFSSGGGRADSTNFTSIGALGQPLTGEQTSANFTNYLGSLYFGAVTGSILSITSGVDETSTDPVGRAKFMLSWTTAGNPGPYLVCYAEDNYGLGPAHAGEGTADVNANCRSPASQVTTSDASRTIYGLKRNTAYAFKIYFGAYEASSDTIVGTHTSVSSGGGGGGSGSSGAPSTDSASSLRAGSGQAAPAPAETFKLETFKPAEPLSPISLISPISPIGLIVEKVVSFFKPAPPPVPQKPPLALAGKFDLVPIAKVEELVLGNLPDGIAFLLKQFPNLRKTFKEVGVTQMKDMEKLRKAKFKLPTITELAEVALPEGTPVARLDKKDKMKIPANVLFVRSPDEIIDLKTSLVFTRESKPEQTISVVSGEELKLIVRPDQPAKKVEGYVMAIKQVENVALSNQILTRSLLGALILSENSLADPVKKPEKGLLVKEFVYAEKDGIFEANVKMPDKKGTFNVATVIHYKDKKLPSKNIDLITVVDPEGYIYEQTGRGRIRIAGAVVEIYQCDTQNQCALWDADKYQQFNPQTTDESGDYSFLTPPGQYYFKVAAKGYKTYLGESFIVKEGAFLRKNIQLRPLSWWQRIFRYN